MEKAGVPVVPGYHGEAQETGAARRARRATIGYPVLIKARRRRRRQGHAPGRAARSDFAEALAARAARGEGRLRRRPRADREISSTGRATSRCRCSATHHGNAVHLFERDCSVQRRHQKVIEEAPAPGMTAELRARDDGRPRSRPRKAIGYVGAGTVEFIVDASRGLRPTASSSWR